MQIVLKERSKMREREIKIRTVKIKDHVGKLISTRAKEENKRLSGGKNVQIMLKGEKT